MAEVIPVPENAWAAAYAVHAESFPPEAADFLSPESFRSLASGTRAVLLGVSARAGKEGLLGYILFRLAGDEAEILSLGVRPAARGQGVGKKLVSAAVAAARARGAAKVFLETSPANDAAAGVYRALGFAACGIRKGYYRHKNGEIEDALTMVLPLVN